MSDSSIRFPADWHITHSDCAECQIPKYDFHHIGVLHSSLIHSDTIVWMTLLCFLCTNTIEDLKYLEMAWLIECRPSSKKSGLWVLYWQAQLHNTYRQPSPATGFPDTSHCCIGLATNCSAIWVNVHPNKASYCSCMPDSDTCPATLLCKPQIKKNMQGNYSCLQYRRHGSENSHFWIHFVKLA